VLVGIMIQLMAAGCKSGSSAGLFDLFGVGGSEVLGAFSGSSGSGASGTGGTTISGSGSSGEVAKVHNPEPASMALFGAGLAGIGVFRRRKARKAA